MLSEAGVKWMINLALVVGCFVIVLLIGIQWTLNQILRLLKEIRRQQRDDDYYGYKK